MTRSLPWCIQNHDSLSTTEKSQRWRGCTTFRIPRSPFPK